MSGTRRDKRGDGRRHAGRTAVILMLGIGGVTAACGSIAASPSTAPTTSPSPSSTSAGPTSFADWMTRQGFGGSSGLQQVARSADYVVEHPGEETLFSIDEEDLPTIDGLLKWLDSHPATECWSDYHAAVRAGLVGVRDGYLKAREAVVAGATFPSELAATNAELAQGLLTIAAPPGCE